MKDNTSITEGARVIYKGQPGTLVAITATGTVAYFSPDSNKRGNDGMMLISISDLEPINA